MTGLFEAWNEKDAMMPNFTVDEAISAIGMGKFQYLLLAYAALGSIGRAMELMILSYIGPALGLSLAQQNWIFFFTYVGMFTGPYIWGYVSDAYGRKMSFLGLSLLTGIAGLASANARNFTTLVVLRTFAGIGTGGTQLYTPCFMEFVPVDNRGTWMIFFFVTSSLGTSIEALMAW
ncbi:organic cation/carnitine transporter 7-like protein, partial [Tanacetum coccineum]